jgi:hypothetical protein
MVCSRWVGPTERSLRTPTYIMRELALSTRLAVLLVTAVSAACSGGAPSGGTAEDAVTTAVLKDKAELFGRDMLYVRIRGWDGRKMDPGALRDETTTPGAEILVFTANPRSDKHCPDGEGELVYRTKAFSLRTSGNLTNGTPKSSYKVSLGDKDDKLFGMKKLNLKSMWNDVSQMREALAWGMFREAGVPAPRHTYAKLCINDRYYGLYSLIEQVDKAMLKDHFGKNNDGNLYKGYWTEERVDIGPATLAYRKVGGDDSGKAYFKPGSKIDERTYRLSTNEDKDDPPELQTYDDLATFVRVHSGVPLPGSDRGKFNTPEYEASLEGIFNVKGFLRWAAVNTLLGAWDNYYATPANYYVYNSGKKAGPKDFMAAPYFTWIPWDYDNTFGVDFFGQSWHRVGILDFVDYKGRSNMDDLPLLRHVFANDDYVRYYLDAVEWANDTLFTEQAVMAKVAKLRPRVEKAAFLEGEFSNPAHTGRQFNNDEVFANGFEHHELRRGQQFILGIKHYVIMRHADVAAQIRTIRADRRMPKGSSGASFPAKAEDLP